MPKTTVTVQPSAEHLGIFEARDAFQQLLDFFDLLSSDEDKGIFAWNLTSTTMNSPLTAVAEAVSLREGVDVQAIAITRITEAADYLSDLGKGRVPRRAIGTRRAKLARSIFRRNTAGIGKTTATFDVPNTEVIALTPENSALALETAAKTENIQLSYLPDRRERREIGSIEGALIEVGTDYNQPAIFIIERKSGKKVPCRVEQSVVDDIAGSTNFRDVWEHKRVSVRGQILFDLNGDIVRIHARSITPIAPRVMTIRDVEDENFTSGEDINSYLEKLREG